jgi:apolipoprotein N-acyltransferase
LSGRVPGKRAGEESAPGVTPAKGLLMCAAFAAAYALGMPGYDLPGLPFAALVPLLVLAASARTWREAARWGLLAGTLANLLLFYWIAYTVAVPGRLGWIAGGISALLVAAYVGVYVSVAAACSFRLRSSFGDAGLLAFPPAWVAVEYGRSVLFTGFPWMLLGYGLAERPMLRQAADLAGMHGLGFLLAASSVFVYLAGAAAARGSRRGALLPLAGVAAIAAFLGAYAIYRQGEAEGRPPRPPGIVAGIAQGGIDQSVKWDAAYQRETLEIYRSLTLEAKTQGASVIVWPETAAPFFYGWEAALSAAVDNAAAEAGVPILFGAPWFDPSGGGKYFNSVFHIDRRGVALGRYDKRRLVPFGEYIPLKKLLFFLRKLTAGEQDFSPGTGPALFEVQGTRAGASVCYEALFPEIIRDGVREGAGWLVNVTNDAWFGDTVAPHQHLAMARMRAVEFRRPMVRAANAGISAIFDERGEAAQRIGLFRKGVAVGEIFPGRSETLYAKTGEIFGISCTIITLLILMATFASGAGARSRGTRRGRHGDRGAGREVRRA